MPELLYITQVILHCTIALGPGRIGQIKADCACAGYYRGVELSLWVRVSGLWVRVSGARSRVQAEGLSVAGLSGLEVLPGRRTCRAGGGA